MGTGALSKRRIHVSISLISQATNDEICSVDIVPLEPVKMPQTVSRFILEDELLNDPPPDGVPGFEANERQ